ncbi:MAG: hypothetical protein C4343_01995 [Chloroflexota bacterium]
MARAEFARRGVDISRCDLSVLHGVCYVRGEIASLPGATFDDLERQVNLMQRVLRQRPEIRDVVMDIKLPQSEITKRLKDADVSLAA